MAVTLVTDSTSCIDDSIMRELGIMVVRLSVHFADESFKEGEVDTSHFCRKLKESPVLPTSSQPSTGEMLQVFRSIVEQGNDILGAFISSELSGTFASAMGATAMLMQEHKGARIEVIDSRTSGSALGLPVIRAAQGAREGLELAELASDLRRRFSLSRIYFIVDTLEYLKKGGRISSTAAMLGTMLNIKPILHVADGRVVPVDKVRSSRAAVDRIVEFVREDHRRSGIEELAVHHFAAEDRARELALRLNETTGLQAAIIPLGQVIGVHVGPGALGVAYVLRDRSADT